MIDVTCSAVVTDLEGTMGSIAFVRQVLFPYAMDRLATYVTEHRDTPGVRALLHETAVLADEPDASEERLVELLRAWISVDRKATPLKTLQGMIWAEGYARGAFAGHIYADAAETLRGWHAAGIPLYVYSSGSIAAQKLLLAHANEGDLTPLFSGYFDTTLGPKTDSESYRAIAAEIGEEPETILFLSDNEAELDAAEAAEFETVRVRRPEDYPTVAETKHSSCTSFHELRVGLEPKASVSVQS
jgi:enolase-phosphatase E1